MALDPGNAGAKNAYYNDIILEDLNDVEVSDRIFLNMQQPTPKVTTTTTTTPAIEGEAMEGIIEGGGEETEEDIVQRTKREFEDWNPRLGEVSPLTFVLLSLEVLVLALIFYFWAVRNESKSYE